MPISAMFLASQVPVMADHQANVAAAVWKGQERQGVC